MPGNKNSVKLLPLAAMEAVMRKAGAPRVSEDAKKALKEVLEEIGMKIAKKAVDFYTSGKPK